MGGKDQRMEWLKHGKGIGHKILHAHGYQPGKGLGVELQGRPNPVTHETMGVNITVNKRGEAVKDTSVRAGLGFKPGGGGGARSLESIINHEGTKYEGTFIPESQTSAVEVPESKPQRVKTHVRPHAAEFETEVEIMNIYDMEDDHTTEGWVCISDEVETSTGTGLHHTLDDSEMRSSGAKIDELDSNELTGSGIDDEILTFQDPVHCESRWKE